MRASQDQSPASAADHPEQTLVYFTTDDVQESALADLAAQIPPDDDRLS